MSGKHTSGSLQCTQYEYNFIPPSINVQDPSTTRTRHRDISSTSPQGFDHPVARRAT
ncbi:hypothetical protein M422DRAFT_32614 [Sphaerobolus stellatus SS14]|uniref:Uncharacterized protein n=1 Tax=Sphaerobolus stellatus (strain SS14) TaxID=990650 RepID=A0A0C9VP47_SPHS4|nr:hypothetical protein M422DRAFT_32614 [Sphaerobolus stellatus SS14]